MVVSKSERQILSEEPSMHSSVGLNDILCEDVQRYGAENHATGIKKCSAEKESRDTSLKISQYGSYKCTTLGPLFASLKD